MKKIVYVVLRVAALGALVWLPLSGQNCKSEDVDAVVNDSLVNCDKESTLWDAKLNFPQDAHYNQRVGTKRVIILEQTDYHPSNICVDEELDYTASLPLKAEFKDSISVVAHNYYAGFGGNKFLEWNSADQAYETHFTNGIKDAFSSNQPGYVFFQLKITFESRGSDEADNAYFQNMLNGDDEDAYLSITYHKIKS
jgi:hypothetical protein